jgi:hypothetical protein
VDRWLASDLHTVSARIPWAALNYPSRIRIAAHALYGVAGNEWKDTVPPSHTPWANDGGAYYEIDLSAAGGPATWTVAP